METRAARVERLAAIPETELPSGRKRRSCTTDEHSLARAERLKTERNGGTLPRNLLVSFLGMLQRHKVDTRSMREACRLLETSMMQVFSTHGWTFCNRLTM
ncbi:hypothetical protein Zm00014a_034906 [Zea mays]|uniref:Uncharacterized protein n=1 Tax=Zea mays TaxID=4577 RepID=A0A3L6G7U4_MAIZE|nr:hypothetical protein Zm00014a_034906 [Zea mays]